MRRRPTRRPPGVSASRMASTGSTCVARRAGMTPETSVAITPTRSPTMMVRGATTVDVPGSSRPKPAIRLRRAGRQQQAAEDADDGGQHADHRGLDHDRAEDLAPRRAERPQQRELARALRDGDRERVEDQEAADEHGDAGEDEQGDLDEAERLADVRGALLGLLLAGEHGRGAAERLVDRGLQLLGRDAVVRRGGDVRDVAGLAGDALHLGQRHGRAWPGRSTSGRRAW